MANQSQANQGGRRDLDETKVIARAESNLVKRSGGVLLATARLAVILGSFYLIYRMNKHSEILVEERDALWIEYCKEADISESDCRLAPKLEQKAREDTAWRIENLWKTDED